MKYVGIDWASELHMAAMVDERGAVLREWEVVHSRRGVDGLVAYLAQQGGPAEVRVAIESGAPLLVDELAQAGYAVFEFNPKQADRFRDRHSPAGCKDDRRDALSLAQALRTDAPWLKPVEANSAETQELVRRTRARKRLVEQRVRTSLHLRDVLARYFPALLELDRKMYDGLLLSLLEAYPTPAQARRARRPRLTRLLQQHRIRALDAPGLQSVLKAPAFHVPEPIAQACCDEALSYVAQLRLLNTQIEQAEQRIDALFATHPDRELVLTVPGIGARTAVEIVAELGDDPRRRTEPKVLTVYAGTAPVTRATGTRKKRRKNGQRASVRVSMRYACNRRLQTALWMVARCSIAKSPWAKAFVAYRLANGQSYNAVLRALSHKWAKILAHLLETRQRYDEDLHIEHLKRANVPWAKELDVQEKTLEDAA